MIILTATMSFIFTKLSTALSRVAKSFMIIGVFTSSEKSLPLVWIFSLIKELDNLFMDEKLKNTMDEIKIVSSKTKDKINLYLKDKNNLIFLH